MKISGKLKECKIMNTVPFLLRTAIELVYKYGEVTTKTLSTAIGRAPKTTRKILHQLVEKDILEWHGTSRTRILTCHLF